MGKPSKYRRVRSRDSRGRPVEGVYERTNKHGGKTYSIVYTDPASGRQHHVNVAQCRTAREAANERAAKLKGLRDGTQVARSVTTFADAMQEWFEVREPQWSRVTAETQRHQSKHLAPILNTRLQDITPRMCGRLLQDLSTRKAPLTVVGVQRQLSGILGLAVRRGTLSRSPMEGLDPAERPRQRRERGLFELTKDDMLRLIQAAPNTRTAAMVALCGIGGLRSGEALALRWADIDFAGNGSLCVERSMGRDGTILPTKSKAGTRTLPCLLPPLRDALQAHRDTVTPANVVVFGPDERYVLGQYTDPSKPMQYRNLRRDLDKTRRAAGVTVPAGQRFTAHVLRHSCGAMLADELGWPLTRVSKYLGHSSVDFTAKVYLRQVADDETVGADLLERFERMAGAQS